MTLLSTLRDRWHPLHRARQWRWFQHLMQRWDPIIPARLASFRRPVYVRLFAHASLLTAEDALEVGIRKTFDVWQASAEQPLRFWDVGTNIGIFTSTLGSAHHDAEIISFEPDPRNLECLRRSMKAWQLPAHLLVAAAVSDRSGRASFTTDLLSGATGALSEIPSTFNELHYCHQGEVRDVEVVRLDDYYRAEAPPGLIKIDVEGAEVSVLRGASSLLARTQPIILFESFGQSKDCQQILEPYGYSFFDADRCSAVSATTTNFLALVRDRTNRETLNGLREVGYPL